MLDDEQNVTKYGIREEPSQEGQLLKIDFCNKAK
jgi:hypothetical protein